MAEHSQHRTADDITASFALDFMLPLQVVQPNAIQFGAYALRCTAAFHCTQHAFGALRHWFVQVLAALGLGLLGLLGIRSA